MMAAPLVFPREWIEQINETLDNDNPLPNTPAILRVPTPLLKMKPEAYIPQLLSFGPYHHSKLEKAIDSDSRCAERNISMAETCKVKFAVMLRFMDIVEMMKQMRPAIERFYRWPISTDGEYSQNFARMMAIDSSFILQFFIIITQLRSTVRLDDDLKRFITIYYACIYHDIEKMENQIPLFVLEKVFDYEKEALTNDEELTFNDLLGKTCCVFSSFPSLLDIAENERDILIEEMAMEPHFLGCVHKSLSLVLHMQPRGEEHQTNSILKKLVPRTELLFPNGMSAGQLARAGIKFKPFSKMSGQGIRLDKESGTLYLPHIIVGEIGTEVWLRNMMALEFNDALRPKYVTRYVAVMGTLVQSPDDVRLLVDRQLISRGQLSLTDECIAQMWHDLRQPFLRGSLTEVQSELFQTFSEWLEKSYPTNKIARKVCGVYEYVSSWKFIAPLAAFLGLLMTAIQTYCSLYHCSR